MSPHATRPHHLLSVVFCVSVRSLTSLSTVPVSSPINSMPIAILNFPILVIAEIIKSMDHREIFVSSLLSAKTKNVIKVSMTRARCSIRLVFDDNEFSCDLEFLKIKAGQDPQNHETVTYKIGPYKVFITWYDVHFFWAQASDKTNCVKYLMTHVSEVFNRPTVSCFSISSLGSGESEFEIVKHSKSVFCSLQIVTYVNMFVAPQVFIQTFNELTNLNSLTVATDLPDDFEYSPTTPDQFQIDTVCFQGRIHWIKLDDYMKCEKIDLDYSFGTTRYYTPTILNTFIRKWMGADCRLETVKVWFPDGNFDFPAVVDRLGEIQHDDERPFVEIEGANGKKATLLKRDRAFKMERKK